uniref:Cornichon family AMPA receptor auxiliary protein 4 n=1 Tax=Stegastes partitus TaxID=144197 RepID=A0A3B4ZD05_9TELE
MEAAVFILSLVDCCALIFLSVYFIITLSDLECDYINARACCSKLNKWVIPEMIGQCLSTMLMLISMHWFIFLLNLPVAAWDIYRYAYTAALLNRWVSFRAGPNSNFKYSGRYSGPFNGNIKICYPILPQRPNIRIFWYSPSII